MIQLHPVRGAMQVNGIRQYTVLAQNTPGCISMALGEPGFDTPRPIKDAVASALARGVTHYTSNQGLPALRKALAQWETARGLPCDEEQIIITVGASGALFNTLLTCVCPGDEVVIPTPAFPLYDSWTEVSGGKPVHMDISRDGFRITRQALENAITPKTKAIILNSPNNPTGVVYDRESLENVKQAVQGKDILILCDNVYEQLSEVPVPDLTLDKDLREQIVLCQSFSKPYAMTGWRVGYLVANHRLAERIMPLNAVQVASISTFLQEACITALTLDVSDMMEEYTYRRHYVAQRLADMGLQFPKPEGAFYIFPNIEQTGMDDKELCTRLITEAGVAAVPGTFFGTPGYIRVSTCGNRDTLAMGLDRMEKFLQTIK